MNRIPGLLKLVEKVPELATPRGALRAAVTAFGLMAVALIVLLYLDEVSLFIAFIVQLILYALNYWLLQQVIRGPAHRRAYADVFFNRFLPTAGLNLAFMFYILLTRGSVIPMDALSPETSVRLVPSLIGILLGLYFGITGLLLIARTVQAVGVDTLALVYSYHPDEGTRFTGGLYDLLRHPVYSGIDRVVLAFGFLNGTAYALLLTAVFVFVWHRIWIDLEEDELVARFGDEYEEFRRTVPALAASTLQGELAILEASTRRAPSVPVKAPEDEEAD